MHPHQFHIDHNTTCFTPPPPPPHQILPNFCWVLQASQEKTFGGKPGALWSMWKWWTTRRPRSPQSVLLVDQNLACMHGVSIFTFLWISNENDRSAFPTETCCRLLSLQGFSFAVALKWHDFLSSLNQVKSSQVNFYLNSHRIVIINTNWCFKI